MEPPPPFDDGVDPRQHAPIRNFHLLRTEDESGVSGTGWVAEGTVFSNGWVVLLWLSEIPSVGIYPSLQAVEHIHGHRGKTRVVFDDEE